MCVRSGSGWGSADSWWWRPWSRSASTRRASSSPSSGLSLRESLHLMNSRMTSDKSTHSWNYPFTEFLSDLLCTRTVPGCRERSERIMITPEYGVLTPWSTCCPTSGPASSPGWWTATSVSWRTRLSPSTWTRGTASSGLASAQTKYNFQLLSSLIISLTLKVLFDPQFSSTGPGNPWDHIILSLSKLHKQSPKKLERLQKSLDSALEMRRWGQTLVNNWVGCR